MLLEGVGEPVQQFLALPSMMGGLGGEWWQAPLLAQQVEPVAAPWPVFKHPVQVGAGHQAATFAVGLPPPQPRVLRQGADAALSPCRCIHHLRMTAVQLKAGQLEIGTGPDGAAAALLQGFASTESGAQRQQTQPPFRPAASPYEIERIL